MPYLRGDRTRPPSAESSQVAHSTPQLPNQLINIGTNCYIWVAMGWISPKASTKKHTRKNFQVPKVIYRQPKITSSQTFIFGSASLETHLEHIMKWQKHMSSGTWKEKNISRYRTPDLSVQSLGPYPCATGDINFHRQIRDWWAALHRRKRAGRIVGKITKSLWSHI